MWTDVRIKDKLEEIYKRVLDIAVENEITTIHISPISGGVMSGNKFTVDLDSFSVENAEYKYNHYKLFILKAMLDVLTGLLVKPEYNKIYIKICIYNLTEYNWLKENSQINKYDWLKENSQFKINDNFFTILSKLSVCNNKSGVSAVPDKSLEENTTSVIGVGCHHVFKRDTTGASNVAEKYYEKFQEASVDVYDDSERISSFMVKMKAYNVAYNENTKFIEAFSPDFNVPFDWYAPFIEYVNDISCDYKLLKPFSKYIRKFEIHNDFNIFWGTHREPRSMFSIMKKIEDMLNNLSYDNLESFKNKIQDITQSITNITQSIKEEKKKTDVLQIDDIIIADLNIKDLNVLNIEDLKHLKKLYNSSQFSNYNFFESYFNTNGVINYSEFKKGEDIDINDFKNQYKAFVSKFFDIK